MDADPVGPNEPLLEKGLTTLPPPPPHAATNHTPTTAGRYGPWWLWVVQFLLAAASFTTFAASRQACSVQCNAAASPASPALEAVPDAHTRWQHFRGTVTLNDTYKGPPTAARRAAWDELTRFRYVAIDEDTRQRLDAPANAVPVPNNLHDGSSMDKGGTHYFAVLEMYHQLHCLQELWLNTYPAEAREDGQPSATNSHHAPAIDDALHHQHLDHCADILRQKLLCDADVTPVTFNWVRGVSHATPNFNVLHRCRRPEDVDAWTSTHGILGADEYLHHKPRDAIQLEDFP